MPNNCNRPIVYRQKPLTLSDKITFGKYKNFTIEEVIHQDIEYIDWCVHEKQSFDLDNEAYKEYIFHLKN